MKFDLTAPCSDCPFRRDIPPYLSAGRVEQILRDVVEGDKTFACHKTTSVGTGKRVLLKDQQHCAGALILLLRAGWPNWRMRLAAMLGIFDPSKLKRHSPVFFSALDMLRRHLQADRKFAILRKDSGGHQWRRQ